MALPVPLYLRAAAHGVVLAMLWCRHCMLQFEEHVYVDPVTNAARAFYFDVVNRTSQWAKPEHFIPRTTEQKVKAKPEHFIPRATEQEVKAEVKEWVVGEKWSWDVNLRCNVCNSVKPISEFCRSSQTYACSFRKCRAC